MGRALVTGGTSGIGLAFVRALAARGDDVVIVARDETRLVKVAEAARTQYKVAVETISADLAVRADVDRIAARLADTVSPIDLCVNNAGFGLHATLLDDDTTLQERAMTVMGTDVLLLSNAAARAMVARGSGTIINVASASAWIYTGNYSAIKRWVVSYTQALAIDLEGTGVQATAVCPGWVKTAFHERAGGEPPHIPGWLWIKADDVATTALRDAARGKVVSVPSLKWRLGLWVAQHGPQSIPVAVSRAVTGSRRGDGSVYRVPSNKDTSDAVGQARTSAGPQANDSGTDKSGQVA